MSRSMDAREVHKLLGVLECCPSARIDTKGKTGAQAWKDCQRGNWLVWLVIRVGLLDEIDKEVSTLLCRDLSEIRYGRRDRKTQANASDNYFHRWDRPQGRWVLRKKTVKKAAEIVKDSVTWSMVKDAMRREA